MKRVIFMFMPILLVLSTASFAAAPALLNFQGKLVNHSTGAPITGVVSVNFILFANASGGSPLWSETQDILCDQNGIFSAVLGKTKPITAEVINFNRQIYVGIEVPSGFGNEMLPRVALPVAAYSFYSISAEAAFLSSYALNAAHAVSADSAPVVPVSIGALVPVGSIILCPTETTPEGYLMCDGTQYDGVTQYPLLYAVIGTMYGGTAPAFRVPDYRGYFLRGWDENASNDPQHSARTDRGDLIGGNRIGTVQESSFESHDHNLQTASRQTWDDGLNAPPFRGRDFASAPGLVMTNEVSIQNSTGSFCGAENRPINIYGMYIIRAK